MGPFRLHRGQWAVPAQGQFLCTHQVRQASCFVLCSLCAPIWARSWTTCSRWPCGAGCLDQMTSRGHFWSSASLWFSGFALSKTSYPFYASSALEWEHISSSHPLPGQKEPLGIIYPEGVAYYVSSCADPRASVPSLWIKGAGGAGKDTLVSKLCALTQSQLLIYSLLFACSWIEILHLAVILLLLALILPGFLCWLSL